MSSLRDTGISASALSVKARAAEWLMERQLSENWSSDDQARLEDWLTQSPAHEVAFARMEATWSRTERLAALNPEEMPPAIADMRRNFGSVLLKLAAGFAIIGVIGIFASNFVFKPHDRVFSTSLGGHETVHFADGSSVELNTNTVVRARMTTEERVVWVDRGEAFFQIKHDTMHPFIVVVGNHRVTDLGTQFVIRRDENRMQVAVVQGRVWLEASDRQKDQHSTLLTPGDVAMATSQSVLVTTNQAQTLANELGWRRGVLIFNHTTLANAAAQFNRYNSQKIVVVDPVAANRTIGGTFPTIGVSDFVHLAQAVLGLHVTEKGETIVISR